MVKENLEIKKFNEYTKDEQMELLFHWWHYYGKMMISLAEIEQFQELVNNDSMLMRNVAIVSFLFGESSQALIMAMRKGNVDNYLAGVKKITDSDEFKAVEEEIEYAFLEEVVGTYNHPEPNVPMSQEEIVNQMIQIVKEKEAENESVLTSKKVHDVYRRCLLKDDEVKDDIPTVDFILGEGVRYVSVFSAERLDENKRIITEMIEELPEIEMGVSFLNMCNDKYGRQWTGEHPTMDLLVQLGNATGVIRFLLPRDCWERFPGKMPYIIRDNEKDNEKVVGNKPKEYKKVIEEFEIRHME